MVTCFHGSPVDFNNPLCSPCAALRVLDLAPGATEKEIKDAYRLLVKVWHPDRFEGDDVTRQVAEAKLKAINAAYILLTSHPVPDAEPRGDANYKSGSREPFAWNSYEVQQAAASPRHSTRSNPSWIFPAIAISFRSAIFVLSILAARELWIALDLPHAADRMAATISSYGKDSELFGLDWTKRRFVEAVEQDLRRVGFEESPRVPDAPQDGRRSRADAYLMTSASRAESPSKPVRTRVAFQSSPIRVRSYLTIGSTSAEVIDKLGAPTSWERDKLVYGRSELYFRDDRVVGWRIDAFASPIPVKLWPTGSVDPTLDSFTVGSTKDAVLVAQGTPTAFTDDQFEYAGSEVYFQNERVVRWKSDSATIPLRIRLP